MTRRLIMAVAASLALACAPVALSGCASRSGASSASTPAQVAQRAMLYAETTFNVAATAEIDAKGTGLLTGAKAAQADALRKQAYQVLLGLRAVYAAGQAPNVASLLALTNQLLILAGQPPSSVAVPIVPTL